MPKYFVNPFAKSGDKTTVPDNAQVDGSVSYDTGWTYDYERDPDPTIDPLTKDIPRDQSNQLMFDVTDNIKFIQDNTAPEWSSVRAADGTGYGRNARVSWSGTLYVSTINGNDSTPGASDTWVLGGETDPTIVAMAGLSPTTNQMIYFTNTDVAAVTALTSFGRAMNAANDAAGGLSVLGIIQASLSAFGLTKLSNNPYLNSDTLAASASAVAAIAPTFFGTVTNWRIQCGRLKIMGGEYQVPGNTDVTLTFSTNPGGYQTAYTGLLLASWCSIAETQGSGDRAPMKSTRVANTGVKLSNSDGSQTFTSWYAIGYDN